MPETLLNSIKITAEKIGDILNLKEECTQIIAKETPTGEHLVLNPVIKEIVKKYDFQKVLNFEKEGLEDGTGWILNVDAQKTEQYLLLGILATAFNLILQPHIKKIQEGLAKTLADLKDSRNVIVVAVPGYVSTEGMFCVDITINENSPFRLCHSDVDTLITVARVGIPNIIKKLTKK